MIKGKSVLTVFWHIPLDKSQNFIVLSREPVTAFFMRNENLQVVIVSLCPMNVCCGLIVLSFHNIALFSVELPIKNSLSSEKATSTTDLLKPLRVEMSFPFYTFHSLIRLSPPPVAITSPNGLKARQRHSFLWAAIFLSVEQGS